MFSKKNNPSVVCKQKILQSLHRLNLKMNEQASVFTQIKFVNKRNPFRKRFEWNDVCVTFLR